MHWQHRFNHAVKRYNDIFKVQMPNITPHVCRHTYTHLGFDDDKDEMIRLEELEAAKKEVEKVTGEKPISQGMFKAI